MTACGAARFLEVDGPVPVPFRACCTAVLLQAAGRTIDPKPAPDRRSAAGCVLVAGSPAPVR
jgi:hypothetical protein